VFSKKNFRFKEGEIVVSRLKDSKRWLKVPFESDVVHFKKTLLVTMIRPIYGRYMHHATL
jgi:hypothetical protein